MVRLVSRSLGDTVRYATHGSAKTAVTSRIAAQYAGYSRVTRDTVKALRVRPQPLMQITNPLITKKICTPRQPYEAAPVRAAGNRCFGDCPHAPATTPSR